MSKELADRLENWIGTHGSHGMNCFCCECEKITDILRGIRSLPEPGVASKPPAPTVTCAHCGTALDFHDGVSVLCSNLQVARSEIDRLKAEVAARYTVEEIRGWLRQKNTSMEGDAVVVKPTLGIAAFIANQRKEKGT